MENKSDVKAIMARFQSSGWSTDETSSSSPAGRPKQALHPTLSSGPAIQTKKPVLESLSGSAINITPKATFLKNTVSTKSDTEAHEPNKIRAMAGRFGNTHDDTNSKPSIGDKQLPPKPFFAQPPEGPIHKPPLNKPSLSSTLSDSRPVFPKLTPAASSKPSWIKEDSGGGLPSTISSTPKPPQLQQKPSSSIIKLRQQNGEQAGAHTDTANKPSPLTNSPFKSTSNFRTAQNMFSKEKERNEQSDNGEAKKTPLTVTNSIAPPKPPASKKPSLNKAPTGFLKPSNINGDLSPGPKRNPLPNSLALGPAPAKPNRPPRVNLENFKRGADTSDNGPGIFKKSITPTPPSSHPSNQCNHATPTPTLQSALPSLPPRHPGAMIQQEEFYDDVDELINSPPPLPPSTGHPSQLAKDDDDDSGEMYEDLDERWEAAEQKQEKRREKDDKGEKKRMGAEKKEQKEREKKEQDARKKFKLVGPLEVIQQGKARVDCRSSKTDLGLKQGDCVDIIRVQGNPEGKWLAQTQDGSIGYVKITSVEIDFNSLKNHQTQQSYDPEVYDDIDVITSDNNGNKGPGVVLPPLPEGGEIYEDVIDPNLEVSPVDNKSPLMKPLSFLRIFDRNRRHTSTKEVPPPSQFTADGNSDQQEEVIDEEIYDDVDSQSLPTSPPNSSFPIMKGKNRTDEMDPKKQKKFEKEEKEFRKKFKYDGEVQVLYQVNIVQTLANKKWNTKELPVKAGETLDVIVQAVDNKLICRNEEGKFGYVSTSHIAMDDGDIYDDIGDDCIYDND